MALRSKGDADGALEQFPRACCANTSDSAELQYQYGQTLRQKGDLEGAVQAFERSLDLNPESQQAYYGLGQALKQLGARRKRSRAAGISDALKAGNEALVPRRFRSRAAGRRKGDRSTMPASAEAHHLLGFALWYGGDRAKAAAALDEVLALESGGGGRLQLPRAWCIANRRSGPGAANAAARHRARSATPVCRTWIWQWYSCGRETWIVPWGSSRRD